MWTLPALLKRLITRKRGPLDDFWYNPAMMPTAAGVPVSEESALKYLTVARCVMLISADLARLPLILYRKFPDGSKKRETGHPLYDILHDAPNPELNSFQWRESGNSHIELWGNHYDFIERDLTGKIRALWPMPDPGQVDVRRKNGQIVYEYKNAKGEEVTRTREQIFHIPGFGFNGIVGLSVINMIRESVSLGLANEVFAARYFGQGMNIGAVMNIPQDLGDRKKEYEEEIRKQHAGLMNSHGVLITQNNETYTPLKMSLDDAQFLEGREFQKIDIAGFYGVPGHKVGIYKSNMNRNNTEQENQGYLDSCLIHRITRYESAISQQLLTKKERQAGLFAEFLVEGLLRADAQGRAEYYNKMFQIAGINANQIAQKENLPPVGPDGDKYFVMMNLVPLDQAGQMDVPLPGDTEPEPESDERSLKEFFSGARARQVKESRSIRMRDRIAKRYSPLILDAATAIVNRESKAIKTQVNRQHRADTTGMTDFLNDFYAAFPEYINQKMGPVLRSYLQATIDESANEIGSDDTEFDKEIKEYIDGYAERHASGSLGQMIALLESGDMADLDKRADEWRERRPGKIVMDESVRASSAAFSFVVFGAGMSMVLRNRGPKTCPYCVSLNGRRSTKNKPLVKAGDNLDPEGGTGPMNFYETKFHVPIHQKCDCYMSFI